MVGDAGWDRAAAADPRGHLPALASRRAWLTGGAAAATAALLSACSGAKPLREKVRAGGKVTPADVPSLNGLLDVEHYAIAAYAAGIPLLPMHSPQQKAAVQFLAQELAHAVQLTELVRRAKGKPRRPRASYDLGQPQTPADVAALLKHVEGTQITAYLNAIPSLSGGARSAAATILANDAQHLAVLHWQTGESPTPSALVKGS